MDQAVAIIASIGLLLPLLTAVLQQPRWSNKTRTAVGVGASALAGVVGYTADNGLRLTDPAEIVAWVVGVVLVSATAYRNIWKPLGTAPAIEAKTSPRAVVAAVAAPKMQAVSEDVPVADDAPEPPPRQVL